MRASRLPALIAIAAIVLQSLWPLIAQAKPRTAATLVPVCTVDGITHYIELRTERAPGDERTASHADHCGLCVMGADRVALPGFAFLVFGAAGSEIRPSHETVAFQRFSVIASRSRAPPASMFVNHDINEHGEGNDEASALRAAGRLAGRPA